MGHLQALAKIKMNHVPYKGAAPAFIDTLSGRIDLQFANSVGVLPHVENKRVRAIPIAASAGDTVVNVPSPPPAAPPPPPVAPPPAATPPSGVSSPAWFTSPPVPATLPSEN